MDSPFDFNLPATGKNFIGRKNNVESMTECITTCTNVAIAAPDGSGKMSLIRHSVLLLKAKGANVTVVEVDCIGIQTEQEFCDRVASACSESFPDESTPQDCVSAADAIGIPFAISASTGKQILVVFREFHVLDGLGTRIFREINDRLAGLEGSARCSCAFLGSSTNAMKEIFTVRKDFHRTTRTITLERIDEKEIVEHVARGFQYSGKVVEKKDILEGCRVFDNRMSYMNQFIWYCDSMSKGYITDYLVREAMSMVMGLNEGRFMRMMEDLTDYQKSLLRAIVEGKRKLCAADVIEDYGLNSSANVKRLKEALCRKEIITFDSKDAPRVQDPLFEHWVKSRYFNIR